MENQPFLPRYCKSKKSDGPLSDSLCNLPFTHLFKARSVQCDATHMGVKGMLQAAAKISDGSHTGL